jgi:hypothetical protein
LGWVIFPTEIVFRDFRETKIEDSIIIYTYLIEMKVRQDDGGRDIMSETQTTNCIICKQAGNDKGHNHLDRFDLFN